jgi:hypothetical protein
MNSNEAAMGGEGRSTPFFSIELLELLSELFVFLDSVHPT